MTCIDCHIRPIVTRGRCRSCYSIAAARGEIAINHYNGQTRCTVPGCISAGLLRRGMCPMHYTRWKRHGTTDDLR